MKKKNLKNLSVAILALVSFAIWTVLIQFVDVQTVGPNESAVGLATVNVSIHNLTGVNMTLYMVTDWLGLVPFAFMLGFALLGLIQWIKRKQLKLVDYSLYALGGFYVAVAVAYIFFEVFVVNYRPVLINGCLEASYPSSTTMLVMCVMPTAVMQLSNRIKNDVFKKIVSCLITFFVVFMVVGRFFSGVHWLSDIIGGFLLSVGLVMMYRFAVGFLHLIEAK